MESATTKINHISKYLSVLFSFFAYTSGILAQTVENPVIIEMTPVVEKIAPGQDAALTITFKIPKGFWLGANDPDTRTPPATVIEIQPHPNFTFGTPQFPRPETEGVPVHLGVTRVHTGKITVVIPFKVSENVPEGDYVISAKITYTPGMNAGHLTTHDEEAYSSRISVVKGTNTRATEIPSPSKQEVSPDFVVSEKEPDLPDFVAPMVQTLDEDKFITRFLHGLFIDPENHGKHIQTIMVPFLGSTVNNGYSIGMGAGLLNATREGIMTGAFYMRGYYNEFVGATAAIDIVSCPAAYFNYWFSAQISEDRNRQVHFRMENFTIGKNDRFGYQLEANAFQDPRFRFYGIGADTKEEDRSNYTHEEFGGILDLYVLPVNNFRIGIGGKIKSVDIKQGADRLDGELPYTVDLQRFSDVPGIEGSTIVGERFNIIYDNRNQEFTPSAGLYAKFTAEFDQITSDGPATISNYGKFTFEARKYYSTIDQKFTLLLRNGWTFTTDKDIPFFDQATLGGESTLRGFDTGRFYGQHAVFGSVELRYQLMHKVLMGYPMDLIVAPFIDAGQVFNNDGFDGKFNINPGMSIRVLNRPNVGFIGNGALGQDGLVFTGGVSLPL